MRWIVQPYIQLTLSPNYIRKISSFDLGLDAKKTNISLTVLYPSSGFRAGSGLASTGGGEGGPGIIVGTDV